MAMGEEQRKRFFKVVERVEVIEQVHSLAIESKESWWVVMGMEMIKEINKFIKQDAGLKKAELPVVEKIKEINKFLI